MFQAEDQSTQHDEENQHQEHSGFRAKTNYIFTALAGCSLLGGCKSDALTTPIDSAGGESAGGQSGKDEDASGGDSGGSDPDKLALEIGEVTFGDLPAYTASKVACQAEVSGPSASENGAGPTTPKRRHSRERAAASS